MKRNRWLWVGSLLLFSLTATVWFSSVQLRSRTKTEAPKAAKQGHSQLTSDSVCQSVRPAVVTLYASTEFGSGSIVSPEGLVLTNYHVVQAAGGGQVRARGWSGSLFKGQVIATDLVNDLALIQLDTKERLPAIHLAKAAAIAAGQIVCAIGSPLGRTGVITLGTLKGTTEKGDLEASILLQPGNSGGPLLNPEGEMIGVNKAIWLSPTGENVGIGFATTTAIAQAFIEQNRQKATAIVERSTTPAIETMNQAPLDFGFHTPVESPGHVSPVPALASTPPAETRLGALINEQSLVLQLVEPNSPADHAGLSAGDRLIAVDQQSLHQLEDLQRFLKRHPTSAVFTVSRQQQQQKILVNFF